MSELPPDLQRLPAIGEEVPTIPSAGARRRAWQRFRGNRGAIAALVFLGVIALIASFHGLIQPHDPNAQNVLNKFAAPSWDHWLGTNDLGQDLWSRIMVGAGVALYISVRVVVLAMVVAVPIGLVSGYVGGRLDNVLMRLVDAGLSFPALVLAVAVAGVLGPGLGNAALAISIVLVPGFVRLTRGSTLAVTQETFVEASRAIGTSVPRMLWTRILPNVRAPLLVAASLSFGGALIAEAGLSFLGLGVQFPDASWGNMLRRAYDKALFTHPWQLLVPGIAIAITVLAFNTLGDGLRDAFGTAEPRRRGRRERRGITTVVRAPETPRAAPPTPLLAVGGLTVEFDTDRGPVRVVDDVSFTIEAGEVLGLVGESGSGKTVTSLSIMRLLASPPGRIVGGSVWFDGRDLLELSFDDMRQVRGAGISMVFQDPLTSLNPAYTVGNQLEEAVRLHEGVGRDAARHRALEMLDLVAIPDREQRAHQFPHQLSGGMRQRVMLAMALACSPRLLIADEPTTALDVTIQAQVLDLLRDLQGELGLSVLLVTHDLGVIADLCDRVAVMYAGQIVEYAGVHDVFARPDHPYTEGLLNAMPQVGAFGEPLFAIPGQVPQPAELPSGCRFAPRCVYAREVCTSGPVELAGPESHLARCARSDELTLRGAR